MVTSTFTSCQSGSAIGCEIFSIVLDISLDSNAGTFGARKEKRESGGCPGLALPAWRVTKTVTSFSASAE